MAWLPILVLYSFWTSLAAALDQEPLKLKLKDVEQRGYLPGEKIPVSCLNRTM
jgi:hypothetical protein